MKFGYKPTEEMLKAWDDCQIVYKGKKYNLASNQLYTFLEDIGISIKSLKTK